MKTVTICGSMRFAEEMKKIALDLEIHHEMNVLQCIYDVNGAELTEAEKEALGRAHFRKIDLSDAVYVVDVNGYTGESARREIEYAKAAGKDVIYHTQFHS